MKINRTTENRAVVPFKNVGNGSWFEIGGYLYVKCATGTPYTNAMLSWEHGCELGCIPSEKQCTLVDVEISYAYRRPEKGERND